AFTEGFTEIESLKRYTGVGTGFCQGKGCLAEMASELARLAERAPETVRLTTIRQPAEPLTFRELANLSVPAADDPGGQVAPVAPKAPDRTDDPDSTEGTT
ncbi:MAG: FAD-dependent oxidoreductase, partial [bacterium]